MFQNVVRAARPAILAARSSLKPSTSTLRAFSTTVRIQSGGPPPPQLYGTGSKSGSVPTDLEQATGLERLQLLGELEGINIFDDGPLDSSRIGTKADPLLVPSYVRGVCFDAIYTTFTLVFDNWQHFFTCIGCRANYWMYRCSRRFPWHPLVQSAQRQTRTLHGMWLGYAFFPGFLASAPHYLRLCCSSLCPQLPRWRTCRTSSLSREILDVSYRDRGNVLE